MNKKFIKAFSLVLAATALATGTSAASIFKQPGHPLTSGNAGKVDSTVKVETSVVDKKDDDKKPTTVNGYLFKYGILETASPLGDPDDIGTVYVEGKYPTYKPNYYRPWVNPFTKPTVKPTEPTKPNNPGFIQGGIYYPIKDAYAELSKYFNLNDHVITMANGTEKAIATASYMFSKDSSVAYYDSKTGKLIAAGEGQTEIYAYTKGGVPFMRFNVYVHAPTADTKNSDSLIVTPADWSIKVNGTTALTVKSEAGKTYTDIVYKVLNLTSKYATVSADGVVTGKRAGAVMVRAYSEADPTVCGDVIIHVGSYSDMIYDGYWSVGTNGIIVNNWVYGNIYDLSSSYISGWIKSAEGTLIPVVKLENVTVSGKPTEIYTSGVISYLDLIIKANETGKTVAEILKEYDIVLSPIYGDKDTVSESIADYQISFMENFLDRVLANTYFPVK